jgi:hypothetical protein
MNVEGVTFSLALLHVRAIRVHNVPKRRTAFMEHFRIPCFANASSMTFDT